MSRLEEQQEFGMRLKQKRIAIGLSQTALAKLSGTSNNRICDYEQGNSMPQQTTLIKLAKALKTTVADLCPSKAWRTTSVLTQDTPEETKLKQMSHDQLLAYREALLFSKNGLLKQIKALDYQILLCEVLAKREEVIPVDLSGGAVKIG